MKENRLYGEEWIMGRYLQEIGEYPLLDTEDVKIIYEHIDAARCLAHEIDATQREITDEDMVVFEAAKAAHSQMITSNLRLVVSIAKNYQRQGVGLGDLVEEGTMGLYRAVKHFDPSRGFAFSTYATHWIRQAISRSIPKKYLRVRIPEHEWQRLKSADAVAANNQGSEYIDALRVHGFSPSEIEKITVSKQMASIDSIHRAFTGVAEEGTIEDTIAGSNNTEDEALQKVAAEGALEVIMQVLEMLSPTDRRILTQRLGLETGEPASFREIALKEDLPFYAVQSRYKIAIRRLRAACAEFGELDSVLDN